MRYIFKFPDIGEGITEGKILQWYVKKGQEVQSQDPLVKMETDKVVTDIPSPKGGAIVNIFGKEGEVIQVDVPLVELEIKGVTPKEAQKIAQEKPQPMEEKSIDEKGFGVVGTLEVAGNSAYLPASNEGLEQRKKEYSVVAPKKVLATPVARAMAKDLGININQLSGSGPAGRVQKKDIQKYYQNMQTGNIKSTLSKERLDEPRVVYESLSQIRKTIARNMSLSKQSAAHMTAMEEVEVSNLVEMRESHKEDYEKKGLKLSYLPFILKAVVFALKEFPVLNSSLDLDHDRLVLKKYYNLGIAVDTKDGLVVPVIQNVDKLSVYSLSKEILMIAKKARERKLILEDFKDGTFTVTNYGSIGGTFGVPIINYPQVGILGIGRIKEIPVVKGGEIVIGQVMPLSLSVDHRIVDGAQAARFLNRLMQFLKDPVSLLLF